MKRKFTAKVLGGLLMTGLFTEISADASNGIALDRDIVAIGKLSEALFLTPLYSVPTTITVTNTNDSGPGSLRQAIADAASGDTINVDVIGTIGLTSGQLVINKNLSIHAPGASFLTISGNNASPVFQITGPGVTAALEGMSIKAGTVGINLSGSHTTVRNSSVSENGTGISNSSGHLTVINSSVSGNRNDGIYGEAGCFFPPRLWVNNSTISGNGSSGIETVDGHEYILNSTISGNTDDGIFDGSDCYSGIVNVLKNTIVAGNPGGDINAGYVNQSSNNLIGNAASAGGVQNGVNGNIVGVSPRLGALQNNGGPTMTHSLRLGSRAINSGDGCVLTENGCGYTHPALTTDQRGMPRNGPADIGAFEQQRNATSSYEPLLLMIGRNDLFGNDFAIFSYRTL